MRLSRESAVANQCRIPYFTDIKRTYIIQLLRKPPSSVESKKVLPLINWHQLSQCSQAQVGRQHLGGHRRRRCDRKMRPVRPLYFLSVIRSPENGHCCPSLNTPVSLGYCYSEESREMCLYSLLSIRLWCQMCQPHKRRKHNPPYFE